MKYHALLITLTGIAVAIILSQTPQFHSSIISLAGLSYIGALILGIFFVSTFTVATSIIALVYLSEALNPLYIAFFAGTGALIGDYLIFRFVRNSLTSELQALLDKIPYFRRHHLTKLIHHKHLAWFMPFIGALIIASPFPDEVGVSLLGVSKINPWRFAFVSFVLNAGGIYILLILAG